MNFQCYALLWQCFAPLWPCFAARSAKHGQSSAKHGQSSAKHGQSSAKHCTIFENCRLFYPIPRLTPVRSQGCVSTSGHGRRCWATSCPRARLGPRSWQWSLASVASEVATNAAGLHGCREADAISGSGRMDAEGQASSKQRLVGSRPGTGETKYLLQWRRRRQASSTWRS